MKKFIFLFLILIFFKNSYLIADEEIDLGKKIFMEEGNCMSCHSLNDAGSNADIGPNLNEIKPSLELVIYTVTNGIGVMPSYKDVLTKDEINAVSIYVSEKSNEN